MGGYTKNIAVIRGIKNGFSADGGPLSGLVKAEKYGTSLKVEVSLINFAPLTEGRYVAAVSDGKHTCILDGLSFEGASEVDTGRGFAALICYVNGDVSPIATAICGNYQSAAIGIKEQIEKQERAGTGLSATKNEPAYGDENSEPDLPPPVYEDEALAKENYYEYEKADKDGGAVCENTQEKENGQSAFENEKTFSAFKEQSVEQLAGGLAHGECFYERMHDEIEKVLKSYPKESALENTVENSRWVRINYGDNSYYVFGVIYGGEIPRYICYGVPSTDSRRPPESLAGMASFIPASPDDFSSGYWVMYQDAATGASVKINLA